MGYTRTADANEITQAYMDRILVEARYIDAVVADTTVTFLGRSYSMPVMTPAFSHLGVYNGREKDGALGAAAFIRTVGDELRYMMSCCGFAKTADIDDSVLHFR